MLPARNLVPLTLAALAVLGIDACQSSTGVVTRDDWRELEAAEARWKDRSFANYQYEIRTACFCPPIINQWVRVTVHGDVVVDAELVEPDLSFEIQGLTLWDPIDSIFAELRARLVNPSLSTAYQEFEADYDPVLGYPTRIEFVERPGVSDAASVATLRNLTPLP